ncbi:MAG: phage holin family protein [Thermoanaerobaculia bacterium]|nr:phage holin family protein [Thermoanaerobaculia bacterium]
MSDSNDKSVGTLFRELTQDLSTLFRSEIELAKLELKQSVTKLGIGGVFLALAGGAAVGGLILLVVVLILVLALWMPAWAATLIVAILMFAAAAGMALLGRNRMQSVDLKPEVTIENVKADIETLKRARGKK